MLVTLGAIGLLLAWMAGALAFVFVLGMLILLGIDPLVAALLDLPVLLPE